MTFKCSLPWPPTVNTFYTVARGRKILSKKGREYKKSIRLKPVRLSGELSVLVEVTPPDKRKRDLDNLLKPILDVLTEQGVYGDDSQISELTIRRVAGEKGSVSVSVKSLDFSR